MQATLSAVSNQRNNALNEAAILQGKIQVLAEEIAAADKTIADLIADIDKLNITITSNERAISRYKKIKNVPDADLDIPDSSDINNA